MAAIFALIFAVFLGFCSQATIDTSIALVDDGTFGAFQDAKRVYVDNQKRIYVTDIRTHQVVMFAQPQAVPQSIGGYGWSPTSFDTPTGVAADGVNVYVSDKGNRRIQRYDRDLNFISTWSLTGTAGTGTAGTSTAGTGAAGINSAGTGIGGSSKDCGYPLGVVLSNAGEFFVLDGENNRIVKYTPDGVFDRTFGDIDAAEGKLQTPLKLAISESQQIYVLEPERLLVYDNYGNFVQEIGENLLHQACGFCITGKEIWIVSPNTIYCLSLDGRESAVIPARNIFSEDPLKDLCDIGSGGDCLYLLTSTTVHRMKRSH